MSPPRIFGKKKKTFANALGLPNIYAMLGWDVQFAGPKRPIQHRIKRIAREVFADRFGDKDRVVGLDRKIPPLGETSVFAHSAMAGFRRG